MLFPIVQEGDYWNRKCDEIHQKIARNSSACIRELQTKPSTGSGLSSGTISKTTDRRNHRLQDYQSTLFDLGLKLDLRNDGNGN